jgi:hypothetical protein
MWSYWAFGFLAVCAIVLAAVALAYATRRPSRGPRGRSGTGPAYVGQKLYAFTTPGTYDFQVPADANGEGLARLYGGGGGGGGNKGSFEPGNGGGGGAYVESRIEVAPGSTLIITVGRGGTGGVYVPVPATGLGGGGAGTASTISGLLGPYPDIAAGGGLGADPLSNGNQNSSIAGGLGGVPFPSQGTLFYAPFVGQQGGTAGSDEYEGAQGGGCPNGGAGGTPTNYDDGPQTGDGGPGTTPGGGGGGAGFGNAGTNNGGPGAGGTVLIYL